MLLFQPSRILSLAESPRIGTNSNRGPLISIV
jgi:hypothetical protein